ncbi:MAG: alpha/beta hydrolase [Cyanobacteria bacterium SZAS LIN-3]|nr:alpha/beta hydrolase [Cyanobacteria bacterium SZAS LIN-3]
MLFQPWLAGGDKAIASIAGVAKEAITIPTKSGAQLSAWYFPVPGAKKTLLISHGNGGTMAERKELIESFLHLNVSVMIYDYAGYGASTGKPSLDEILEDGDAAYDYLVKEKNISPAAIVLVGESIGSGVACHTAAHKTCNSIILLAPFSSLMKLAKFKLPWLNLYPQNWFPYADIDNKTALAHFSNPVLILYGQQDLTIPSAESKDLAKVCKECYLVEIPGRGHLVYYPPTPQYEEALNKFLMGIAPLKTPTAKSN